MAQSESDTLAGNTASASGSLLAFFADGATINIVLTTNGTGVPAPISGDFNIEIFTSIVGGIAPNYQASAFIQGAQLISPNTVEAGSIASTEQLLNGNYMLVDQTGSETISVVGSGAGGTSDTVVGSQHDTISGSTIAGNAQLIDASGANGRGAIAGPMTIIGGAGNTTVWGGDDDSITGGAGPLTVFGAVGGARTGMTITGGAGGLMAFDFGTNNSVTGGGQQTFIDDSYGSGGGSTLTGGSGGASFVVGAAGDVLMGGSGSLTTLNAVLGSQTVVGGSGFGTQVEGGPNDVIFAGSGNLILVAAGATSTVFGGTNTTNGAGTDVYTLGAGDSIVGQAGSLTVGGNAVTNVTIRGGAGNLDAFNLGTHYSVVGATTGTTVINDAYGAGGSDTLIGGGSATTIVAGANDSIVGGAGALEARIRSNTAGAETVNLSAAASGIRDVSVTGGTGATVSVTGFNTGTDKIESATSSGTYLVAHAGTDGSGNVVLNFLDGSTMTLANVTNVNAITFTT